MIRSSGRWMFLVALAVAGLAFAGEAAAERRIAVLDIDGARSPRLQQSIAALVKQQKHEVVRAATYRDAARRLDATGMTAKDVARVCGGLGADGVLEGTLAPDAGRYRLTLRLRSGKTGAIAWKQAMALNAPRLSDRIERGLAGRLATAIAGLPRVGRGTGLPPAEPEEGFIDDDEAADGEDEDDGDVEDRAAAVNAKDKATKDKAAKDRTAKDKAAKDAVAKDKAHKAEQSERARRAAEKKAEAERARAEWAAAAKARRAERSRDGGRVAANADDGDSASGDEGDDADDDGVDDGGDDGGDDDGGDGDGDDADAMVVAPASASSGGSAGATAAASLHAGMSFTTRSLNFASSGAAGPPGYEGRLMSGIHLSGDVYPMAFLGQTGLLPRFGLGLTLDRVFATDTAVDDGAGGTELLPTSQQRFEVDLRYRHQLGRLTAIGLVAYGSTSFAFDRGDAAIDVPNVGYRSFDLGGIARYQVLRRIALLAAARLMLVTAAGEIQEAEQYGVGTVFGLAGELGVELDATARIALRLAARYQSVHMSFEGNGLQSDRDGDGAADVDGATDGFVGGWVTAGYRF